jgi:hypothetical protein
MRWGMINMSLERTVLFEPRGPISEISEIEWPLGLPLPKEPYLPKGSIVIEMPNGKHKGVARGPIGELYHCLIYNQSYKWMLADDIN